MGRAFNQYLQPFIWPLWILFILIFSKIELAIFGSSKCGWITLSHLQIRNGLILFQKGACDLFPCLWVVNPVFVPGERRSEHLVSRGCSHRLYQLCRDKLIAQHLRQLNRRVFLHLPRMRFDSYTVPTMKWSCVAFLLGWIYMKIHLPPNRTTWHSCQVGSYWLNT